MFTLSPRSLRNLRQYTHDHHTMSLKRTEKAPEAVCVPLLQLLPFTTAFEHAALPSREAKTRQDFHFSHTFHVLPGSDASSKLQQPSTGVIATAVYRKFVYEVLRSMG